MTRITAVTTRDIRARTSLTLAGSDAVHTDPDYSAAYAVLHTDHVDGLRGEGFTFTIGRGNDLVCAAIEAYAPLLVDRELDELTADLAGMWRRLTNDSQLRWLGPDKGVVHLAVAALVNAVWDLWAKQQRLPLWQLVCNLSPEQIVDAVDFRYLTDALTRDEALDLLRAAAPGRAARTAELRSTGLPAYITSAGWLGYPESQVRELCRARLAEGWTSFKTKVGVSIESDRRRCEVMREELGDEVQLMADANQVWDVGQAVEWMRQLDGFGLRWIEEPTSPDDVLGHARIRRELAPLGIKVATGEHVANRVLFKQLLQAEAIDYLQADACRVGGFNEVLAIVLLAAKFGVPVCCHAGGIGLCEYVQHIAAIDYIAVSASLHDRTTEYASHLHEHFVDPAVVHNGRYVLPQAPGYSADLHPESIERLGYPTGAEWR